MVKGRGGWDVVRLLGLALVTRGSSVVVKWVSDCLIIPVFSPLHPGRKWGGGFTTEVDLRCWLGVRASFNGSVVRNVDFLMSVV